MQYILGILTQGEMLKKSISPDISTQRVQVPGVGWEVQLIAPISTAHKNSAASKKIRMEKENSFLLESNILLSWGWRSDSAVKDARFPGRGHGFSS